MTKTRALIVEDDALIVPGIRDALVALHHESDVAMSKQEAIAAIRLMEHFLRSKEGRPHREGAQANLGRMHNNLGLAYYHAGKPAQAIDEYKQALKHKRAIGDLFGTAVSGGNIAICFLRLRRYERHLSWRRQALALLQRYGWKAKEAYLWRTVGSILCDQGNRKRGLAFIQHARDLYASLSGMSFDTSLCDKTISRYSSL